jgi:hypothetical protein
VPLEELLLLISRDFAELLVITGSLDCREHFARWQKRGSDTGPGDTHRHRRCAKASAGALRLRRISWALIRDESAH